MWKALVWFLRLAVLTVVFLSQRGEKALGSGMETGEWRDSVKRGINPAILPLISYGSDIGFQFGVAGNIFLFGDGHLYPAYNHSVYLECSRSSRGSGVNRLFYDSECLVHGLQISADLCYLTDRTMDFYGVNGYRAGYNPGFTNSTYPDYKSEIFYKADRRLFRFISDIRGETGLSNFHWLGGLAIFDLCYRSVDVARYNKGKDGADQVPSTTEMPGLYERYLAWEVLDPAELKGGSLGFVKTGLVYDSRDCKPNPSKGLWTEASLACFSGPGFRMNASFAKISLIHRHYFPLFGDRLTMAYRLGMQSTISGKAPFYIQSHLISSFLSGTLTDGLGGQKTLRGMLRNRVVGDGIVYGNLEGRWKFHRTYFLRQNFYFALNLFLDFGRVIRYVEVDQSKVPGEWRPLLFPGVDEAMHKTMGFGLKVAMNQNFIISGDYGKALDSRDGDQGLYLGLNFLF